MLGKLHIAPTAPHSTLQSLLDLTTEALESKVATEVSSRNALTKLQISLSKALAAAESGTENNVSKSASATGSGEYEAVSPTEVDVEKTEADVECDRTDAGIEEMIEPSEFDVTLRTKFTGPPDAEGTVMVDFDEYDDEEVDKTVVEETRQAVVSGRDTNQSLVESLLSDDNDIS
jgi:condensin complex subunit 3